MANPPQQQTGIPQDWRVRERYLQSQNIITKGYASIPRHRIMVPQLDIRSNTDPVATGTWPTTDLAMFTPFELPGAAKLINIWIASTAAGGNFDVGVYNIDGTRVCSHGGINLGTNTVTPFPFNQVIAPGRYYAAGVAHNNTERVFLAIGWTAYGMMGLATALNAYPLPATVTFEALPSQGVFCASLEFE